jgi:aromatic-L-amino-acid decarboxylase
MSHIEDIRNQLNEIQSAGNALEPAKELMKKWKELVDDYGFNYLDNLNSEKGFTFKNNKKFLDIEFDEEPKKFEVLIDALKTEYNDSGISTASGTYLGFIPGGGVYPSSLGDYIAAITNKYSGIIYGCPAAVDIENSIIKWACSSIGYPDSSTGNICSGSSTGILYSINVARDSIKAKSNIYSKLVLYCTSVCHGCIFKALKVGGLADVIIRRVPTDDDFKMLPEELEDTVQNDISNNLIPFMIFSNAGSTDV